MNTRKTSFWALAAVLWPLLAPAAHMTHSNARPALALGVAADAQGALWSAGLDDHSRLFIQSTTDDGKTWQPRQVLNTGDDVIAADGESRPAMGFGPNGAVVISYTQPLSKPYTGNIRLLRSADGGRTFAPPVTVHDDRQLITHRFASLAFDGDGDLNIVWVDKRDATDKAYAGAALYGKVSHDGGATFEPDRKLADHSCECCRIALAAAPDGKLVALWRHVFDGSIRDHAFAPLSALGSQRKPTRATQDGWVLAACPHHGPGLAAASGGGYHAVWYGLREGVVAARYGRLGADGQPMGAVQALPDAGAEHADVAASGHHVAVVWRSYDGQQTRLRAWLSDDDGAHFTLRELAGSTADNDHPRLLRNGNTLQVVWRTLDDIQVYRLAP